MEKKTLFAFLLPLAAVALKTNYPLTTLTEKQKIAAEAEKKLQNAHNPGLIEKTRRYVGAKAFSEIIDGIVSYINSWADDNAKQAAELDYELSKIESESKKLEALKASSTPGSSSYTIADVLLDILKDRKTRIEEDKKKEEQKLTTYCAIVDVLNGANLSTQPKR